MDMYLPVEFLSDEQRELLNTKSEKQELKDLVHTIEVVQKNKDKALKDFLKVKSDYETSLDDQINLYANTSLFKKACSRKYKRKFDAVEDKTNEFNNQQIKLHTKYLNYVDQEKKLTNELFSKIKALKDE